MLQSFVHDPAVSANTKKSYKGEFAILEGTEGQARRCIQMVTEFVKALLGKVEYTEYCTVADGIIELEFELSELTGNQITLVLYLMTDYLIGCNASLGGGFYAAGENNAGGDHE